METGATANTATQPAAASHSSATSASNNSTAAPTTHSLKDMTETSENHIRKAILFLQHPSVQKESFEKKQNFLRGKGISDEEINEAARRVAANAANAGTTGNTSTEPYNERMVPQSIYQQHPGALHGHPSPPLVYPHQIAETRPSGFFYLLRTYGVPMLVGVGLFGCVSKFYQWYIQFDENWKNENARKEESTEANPQKDTALQKAIDNLKKELSEELTIKLSAHESEITSRLEAVVKSLTAHVPPGTPANDAKKKVESHLVELADTSLPISRGICLPKAGATLTGKVIDKNQIEAHPTEEKTVTLKEIEEATQAIIEAGKHLNYDEVEQCMVVVLMLLNNILKGNDKTYRKINITNQRFGEKVGPLRNEVLHLLQQIGFTHRGSYLEYTSSHLGPIRLAKDHVHSIFGSKIIETNGQLSPTSVVCSQNTTPEYNF